ncbi:pyridoxamine 5'-phosphate oxidase family protein [Methylobacterium soli]|uniref:Pyridoxamine 5-phosphate oxidase n=1 Tax=Methylobacterium soli TaxID=553447 RepID=A0A6L3T4M8_9HYPH|nr:pyridoxamine 5'-phosphate oxidase family protein [Methylobacterium soli]KAB1081894.1 pyridoxamine 5-phosphate oxidase [Methylobacterium soli]GJE42689.1 hypothetical protein AEGHOMDF_1861 [Methylobacterium soli]
MRHRFFDLAFTPSVQSEQARRGSRAAYASAAAASEDDVSGDRLSDREAGFVGARDSFYLASVSETGWPYVQHRGGPVGFVRQVDDRTLGWSEFVGNRQYVTQGNLAADDRVAMIFVDYPNRRRLKVLGRLRMLEPGEAPDLAERFGVAAYRARTERLAVVTVEAFDWNCPQHITPRFSLPEIEAAVAPLHARIAELEAQVAARGAVPA